MADERTILPESYRAARARWRAEERWEFIEKQLIGWITVGMSKTKAHELAMQLYPPLAPNAEVEIDEKEEEEEEKEENQIPEIPGIAAARPMSPAYRNNPANVNLLSDVLWVYCNMGYVKKRRPPNHGAGQLLEWANKHPNEFVRNMLPKVMPSKRQFEAEARKRDDGRKQFALIAQARDEWAMIRGAEKTLDEALDKVPLENLAVA